MKKKFTFVATNAIAPAAPASVWGKGCAGKGVKIGNALIERKTETDEKENN